MTGDVSNSDIRWAIIRDQIEDLFRLMMLFSPLCAQQSRVLWNSKNRAPILVLGKVTDRFVCFLATKNWIFSQRYHENNLDENRIARETNLRASRVVRKANYVSCDDVNFRILVDFLSKKKYKLASSLKNSSFGPAGLNKLHYFELLKERD